MGALARNVLDERGMRDILDSSKADKVETRERQGGQRTGEPGWQKAASPAYRGVPAGFGAHFPTNPPWQARRASWRMFVRGLQGS